MLKFATKPRGQRDAIRCILDSDIMALQLPKYAVQVLACKFQCVIPGVMEVQYIPALSSHPPFSPLPFADSLSPPSIVPPVFILMELPPKRGKVGVRLLILL